VVALRRHQAVDRIARILELVAGRVDGLTLSEMAAGMKAPVSSIQSLVNGLVAAGYLDRQQMRYLLGPAPYILTLQAKQMPARSITHDDLVALQLEGNFTVVLGVRVGDDFVYVDEAGDHPQLQYRAQTRARQPLLEATTGWALLAALDDDDLHNYLASHPRQDLVQQFLEHVSNIRATGVVTAVITGVGPRPGGGTQTGVVSTAVRDPRGHVVGAVCIGQDPVFFRDHEDKMIEILLRHTSHWATRRSTSDSLS
jgi:DNA-binding IclR family transcriptional regulator